MSGTTPRWVLKSPAILAGLASPQTFDPQRIGLEIEAVPLDQRNAEGIWRAYHNRRGSAIYEQLPKDRDAALVAQQKLAIRQMVHAIRVLDREDRPIPAFVSTSPADGMARRYASQREISRNVDIQIRVLKQARDELLDFERRYHDLADLAPGARALAERASQRIADLERDLGLPDAADLPPPRPSRPGRRSTRP